MVAAPEGIGLDDADLDDKVQVPVRRSDDFGQPMSGSIAFARVPHPTSHSMVAAKTGSSGAPECDCSRIALAYSCSALHLF